MLIAQLQNYGDKDRIEEKMVDMLREVGEKIDACDEDIRKHRWVSQWKKDLEDEIINNDVPTTQGGE